MYIVPYGFFGIRGLKTNSSYQGPYISVEVFGGCKGFRVPWGLGLGVLGGPGLGLRA